MITRAFRELWSDGDWQLRALLALSVAHTLAVLAFVVWVLLLAVLGVVL